MQVKSLDYFGADGTHLQGYVRTDYTTLKDLFGEGLGSGDKTTQEWVLEFSDGTVATIYDWKEYETPMGIYDWHVGGLSKQAVWNVEAALRGEIEIVDQFDLELE